MNTECRIRNVRAAYAALVSAVDHLMVDIERRTGDFRCHLPTMRAIQETVALNYGLPISAMSSPVRSRVFAEARHVAMCLARELTHHSQEEIGRCFGGRDHGTVTHAETRVYNQIATDKAFAKRVEVLRESCRNSMRVQQVEAAA